MAQNGKLKLALYWAASCGGCEIAIVELREKILALDAAADILFWPCAIGKRSVFDNGYTVSVVPTFAVIDRQGNIQIIRSFMGELEQKRRIVERFL